MLRKAAPCSPVGLRSGAVGLLPSADRFSAPAAGVPQRVADGRCISPWAPAPSGPHAGQEPQGGAKQQASRPLVVETVKGGLRQEPSPSRTSSPF